ncbi:MAG TPA: UpxY family transcription antiterminator [Chitinophagaceae bacterium]|nr:UpxY family transcription antiterminator [Chitinophagaceae bacterium]
MTTDKQWYAVYTRSRWEKKVSTALTRKKIENFCPLNRSVRQWADRKKIVYEPLFSCYVFVRASENEHLAIRQTEGIVNFVHWLGKPALIRNEEIDAVKRFLNEHDNIMLEKIDVSIDDRIRITSGPLMECEGSVVQVKNSSIKVHLPSLGYAMVAEVKMTEVEIIHKPYSNYTKTFQHAAY